MILSELLFWFIGKNSAVSAIVLFVWLKHILTVVLYLFVFPVFAHKTLCLFFVNLQYVRPGAVPMSGAATSIPGGGPGQVRPLVNMGPMAGRGRGEWRPTGIKNASPMQKGFHSGFGLPAWGNNMAGRGFGGGGGLEFTLPSHK